MNKRNRYYLISACRKTKRFAKGTLEGFVGGFLLASHRRYIREKGFDYDVYGNIGFFAGAFTNLASHGVVTYLADDLLAFAPFIVTNIISLGYESGRKHFKKK